MDEDMDMDEISRRKKAEQTEEGEGGVGARARNRTVMLTPEITGQVRAMISQGLQGEQQVNETANPSSAGPATELVTNSVAGLNPQEFGAPVADSMREVANPLAEKRNLYDKPSGSLHLYAEKWTPIVGFLVSFDKDENGEVIELRIGRWIISSKRTSEGNFIVIDDETVSPLHGIIKVSEEDGIQVLDQLSEFGTVIISDGEEKKLSGSMDIVKHGDILKIGERSFKVCLL